MSEDNEQESSGNRFGMGVGIAVIAFILYVLSPPFLGKLLVITGMRNELVQRIFGYAYVPIWWYIDNRLPGSSMLDEYYDACLRWLGLIQ